MAVVAILTDIFLKLTVANTFFLWFLITFVQVEETQCAVPIDVKEAIVVTEVKEPPRKLWLLPDVNVEPLISRRGQKNSHLKPIEAQRILYLLQGFYHPKYSEDFTDHDSISKHKYDKDFKIFNTDELQYKKSNRLKEFKQKKKLKNLLMALGEEDTQQALLSPVTKEVSQRYANEPLLDASSLENIDDNFQYEKSSGILPQSENIETLSNLLDALNYKTKEESFAEENDVDIKIINRRPTDRTESYENQFSYAQNTLNGLNKMASEQESSESVTSSSEESRISENISTQINNHDEKNIIPVNKYRYKRATRERELSKYIIDHDYMYLPRDWWPNPQGSDDYHRDDPYNPNHPISLNEARYISGTFQNDDYQPFFGPRPNPYLQKSLGHGVAIFGSQIVPIMRSMLKGRGLEQSPNPSAPFRVAWQDLQHYDEPPPVRPDQGPRSLTMLNETYYSSTTTPSYNSSEDEKPNNCTKSKNLAPDRRKYQNNDAGFKNYFYAVNKINDPSKVTPKVKTRVFWVKVETTTILPVVLKNILNRKKSSEENTARKKKSVPKKLWWSKKSNNLSVANKNKIVIEKDKNYTIILRVD